MNGRRALAGFLIGVLFGLGLAVSQMVNPEKVLAFLNLAGRWDPSLILVMGGAVTVAFVGYRWAGRQSPLLDTRHHLPTSQDIDGRLVFGSVLFGIGWGIAGYCPGPAITALGSGTAEPYIFVAAMLAGSQCGNLLLARLDRRAPPASQAA